MASYILMNEMMIITPLY